MFEFVLTLLVFGGVWFWLFAACILGFMLWLLESEESGAGATFILCGALAALLLCGNANWLTWVAEHPFKFIVGVAGYLGTGVAFGAGKWWLYVRDTVIRYREKRTNWLRKEIDTVSFPADGESIRATYRTALETGEFRGECLKAWKKYKAGNSKTFSKPVVSENKARITRWMTYWPLIGLWTLVNDPVRRFFSWAYRNVSGKLQRMSDRAFDGIDGE